MIDCSASIPSLFAFSCRDDRIFCISNSGELVVLSATDEFEVLAKMDLGEPSHSTPSVSNGVMYLRTLSHVMSLGGSVTAE